MTADEIQPADVLSPYLVVVDEIAYFLATAGEGQEGEDFSSLLRDLVAQGRAVGISSMTADEVGQPAPTPLIYHNLLIGGKPGKGKSVPLNLAVAHAALLVDCLACPPGCRSCSQDESTCECYEHAHLHPDNEPDQGREVA